MHNIILSELNLLCAYSITNFLEMIYEYDKIVTQCSLKLLSKKKWTFQTKYSKIYKLY